MAAAIITPARLDFDSRTSSVIIALPAPSAISSASWSRPAARQAAAGSRRNCVRNAGSTSRRSISLAATSASVADTRLRLLLVAREPRLERLEHHDQHGDEEHDPYRGHHGPHDPGWEERVQDRLVAQRHPDREQRRA